MKPKSPPEELDMQAIDNPRWKPFQFLTSLLLVRRGWFANHALEPTAFTQFDSRFGIGFTDGFRGRGSAFGR